MTENAPDSPELTKISNEDRLRALNVQLRLQNVQLQLQLMQADLQKAVQSRVALLEEAGKIQKEFIEKYSVDLSKVQINEDGSLTIRKA